MNFMMSERHYYSPFKLRSLDDIQKQSKPYIYDIGIPDKINNHLSRQNLSPMNFIKTILDIVPPQLIPPNDPNLAAKLQKISKFILNNKNPFQAWHELQLQQKLERCYDFNHQSKVDIIHFFTVLLTNCKNQLLICKLVSTALLLKILIPQQSQNSLQGFFSHKSRKLSQKFDRQLAIRQQLEQAKNQQIKQQQSNQKDDTIAQKPIEQMSSIGNETNSQERNNQEDTLKQGKQQISKIDIKQSTQDASEQKVEKLQQNQVQKHNLQPQSLISQLNQLNQIQRQRQKQSQSQDKNKEEVEEKQIIDDQILRKDSFMHSDESQNNLKIMQEQIESQEINSYRINLIKVYLNLIDSQTIKYMIIDNRISVFQECIDKFISSQQGATRQKIMQNISAYDVEHISLGNSLLNVISKMDQIPLLWQALAQQSQVQKLQQEQTKNFPLNVLISRLLNKVKLYLQLFTIENQQEGDIQDSTKHQNEQLSPQKHNSGKEAQYSKTEQKKLLSQNREGILETLKDDILFLHDIMKSIKKQQYRHKVLDQHKKTAFPCCKFLYPLQIMTWIYPLSVDFQLAQIFVQTICKNKHRITQQIRQCIQFDHSLNNQRQCLSFLCKFFKQRFSGVRNNSNRKIEKSPDQMNHSEYQQQQKFFFLQFMSDLLETYNKKLMRINKLITKEKASVQRQNLSFQVRMQQAESQQKEQQYMDRQNEKSMFERQMNQKMPSPETIKYLLLGIFNLTLGASEFSIQKSVKRGILNMYKCLIDMSKTMILENNRNWDQIIIWYEDDIKIMMNSLLQVIQHEQGSNANNSSTVLGSLSVRNILLTLEYVRNFRYIMIKETSIPSNQLRVQKLYHAKFRSPAENWPPGQYIKQKSEFQYKKTSQNKLDSQIDKESQKSSTQAKSAYNSQVKSDYNSQVRIPSKQYEVTLENIQSNMLKIVCKCTVKNNLESISFNSAIVQDDQRLVLALQQEQYQEIDQKDEPQVKQVSKLRRFTPLRWFKPTVQQKLKKKYKTLVNVRFKNIDYVESSLFKKVQRMTVNLKNRQNIVMDFADENMMKLAKDYMINKRLISRQKQLSFIKQWLLKLQKDTLLILEEIEK